MLEGEILSLDMRIRNLNGAPFHTTAERTRFFRGLERSDLATRIQFLRTRLDTMNDILARVDEV